MTARRSVRRFAVGVLAVCLGARALGPVDAAPPLPPDPERLPGAAEDLARAELPRVTGTMDFGSVASLHRAIQAWEAKRPKKPQTDPDETRPRANPESGELEEEGIDLLEAALAHLEPRAYPEDRVNWERIAQAARSRGGLAPAAWRAGGKAARWEFIGPRNVPVPYRIYFGQGPLNGRANAAAFDPVERATYYLGAAGGGVWKTADAGRTWAPLSDAWPLLSVSALACPPRAPGAKATTILAGTGDFPYPAIAPALGLMRSDDGGKTWSRWGPEELRHFAISRILVDPEDPRIVTVSCGRGTRQWGAVWRTTDDGATWAPAIPDAAAWCALSVGARAASGRRWYWAVGYDAAGFRRVMRSGDRGATWTQAHRAGPHNFLNLASVAASPVDPETAYVLLGGLQQILVTRDGGGTFSDVTRNFPGGYNWSQDWYDLWLGVSNVRSGGRQKDSVYVALIDLVHSLDATSWRSIGRTYTPIALAHNDQQGFAIDPKDPAHLLTASDGGVYDLRYDVGRNVHAFSSLNANLGITQFYRGALDPANPDVLLAGTQDNATPACPAGKGTWTNVGGGDGAYCGINPKRPDIQFASSQFLTIYRTGNRWKTSAVISPTFGNDRRGFIAPFVLDPTDPTRLYAGTNFLWLWDDTRQRWTARLGNQQLAANGSVSAIAVAPSDGRRIYTGSTQGELWMTRDAGASWARLDRAGAPLPIRTITAISVHPTNPSDLLVSLSGTGAPHIWRCPDAAAPAWTNVSAALPDAPANAIVRDPAAPAARWIASCDLGVFTTEDAGNAWTDATAPLGLPGVHVNDLLIAPDQRTLTAVTFGRGLWRIALPR